MSDISKNIAGSLVSAVVIALLFSLWNDYIYKKDRLTGYWKVSFVTTDSSYGKYVGLRTYYDFIIGQEGSRLTGDGEKISEESVNGIIEYDTNKRTHLELTGGLSYRVFSNNIVDIKFKENGRRRPSSTILKLSIESADKLSGTFISTIAASKGKVVFTRVSSI